MYPLDIMVPLRHACSSSTPRQCKSGTASILRWIGAEGLRSAVGSLLGLLLLCNLAHLPQKARQGKALYIYLCLLPPPPFYLFTTLLQVSQVLLFFRLQTKSSFAKALGLHSFGHLRLTVCLNNLFITVHQHEELFDRLDGRCRCLGAPWPME